MENKLTGKKRLYVPSMLIKSDNKRQKIEETPSVRRLVPHIEGNWATYLFVDVSKCKG